MNLIKNATNRVKDVMESINKTIIKLDNLIVFSIFSVICFLFLMIFLFNKNYNAAFIVIIFSFLYNIVLSFSNIKKHFIFLFFNLSIFLFILSRPFISMYKGDIWWYFSENTIFIALIVLFVALISLLFFYLLFNKNKFNKVNNVKIKIRNVEAMKKVVLLLFIISYFFFMYQQVDKLLFMKDKTYALVYSTYNPSFPFYFKLISSLMSYFVCIYLALLPTKKQTYFVLALFISSAIPNLIIGSRGSIMEIATFSLVYCMIRSCIDKKLKVIWFDKIEKIIIATMIPVCLFGLGAYNYVREGAKIPDKNLVEDFVYKQGTTFDTLCQGIEYNDSLQKTKQISYSFGEVIDYVYRGTIGQKVFGTKALSGTNSIDMATKSNSLAHHLSYVVMENEYLIGHGRGTSYILENYIDFGYFGVILGSACVAFFISFVFKAFNKNVLTLSIILVILSKFFMLPRTEFSGTFYFLCTFQFWISIILCIGGTKIYNKLEKLRKNN